MDQTSQRFNGVPPGSHREKHILQLRADFPDRDGYMLLSEVRRAVQRADRIFVRVNIEFIQEEAVEISRPMASVMVNQFIDHGLDRGLSDPWIPARFEHSDLYVGQTTYPRYPGT